MNPPGTARRRSSASGRRGGANAGPAGAGAAGRRVRNLLRLRPSSTSDRADSARNNNEETWPMRSFVTRLACGALLAMAASAALASPPDPPYTVKPGDTLMVSVWKEPELHRPVLIEPDGTFSFPLCGEINAHDKTVGQLQQEITQHLARFISDPVVTVSLQ